jgi:hypothetical protein
VTAVAFAEELAREVVQWIARHPRDDYHTISAYLSDWAQEQDGIASVGGDFILWLQVVALVADYWVAMPEKFGEAAENIESLFNVFDPKIEAHPAFREAELPFCLDRDFWQMMAFRRKYGLRTVRG